MKNIILKYKILLAALIVLIFSTFTHAEIYRYQDENGRWHYGDRAPENSGAEKISLDNNEETPEENKKTSKDLALILMNKIQPANDIEKATLAVMKIKTPSGSGSGFFISDDGYLLTNKHVVRFTASDDLKKDLKQAENNEKEFKEYLRYKKKELSDYKKDIDDYKERLDKAANKSRMQNEYNHHLSRYKKQKKDYQNSKKEYAEIKKKLDKHKRSISLASTAYSFTIILKDETTLKAKLIAVSKNIDVALLKIIGNYKTPFLQYAAHNEVSQSMEVYAIGSPLGFNDYVTKGIVTRNESDRIVTDTQILPGNSGGPLVTTEGNVIGINTQVLRADGTLGSEVFGFAIPIHQAHKEFEKRLTISPDPPVKNE